MNLAVLMDRTGRQTVLLVDDCPSARKMYAHLLDEEGYATLEASDGNQGVQIARSALPDVVVMDLDMPEVNGLEATRALRTNPATAAIPIIMVSAHTSEEEIVTALSAGVDEYIYKPIRPREFRLRVRSMVRLRSSHLQMRSAHEELQRRTHVLTELNRFHEAVLADNSFEALCRATVKTAAQITQSRRVSLLLPNSSGEGLCFAHAIGLDERIWRRLNVPFSSPIAGRVFTTQQEIVANPGMLSPPAIGRYESPFFASLPIVSTPLRTSDGPIGVLNVTEKNNGGEYTPEEAAALRQFTQTAAFALENAATRQKLDETRDSIIFSMAKLSEHRHPETGRHLERVRDLSVLLAQHLRDHPDIAETIDRQFVTDLRRAAPLHDIGKVAIPDTILRKPSRLTEAEFVTMQNHTLIGAGTLRAVIAKGHDASFLQMAMDIALYHHERFDGGGYPEGLKGDEIPLSARIVCLADSYDAIRTKREYKPTRSHGEAGAEIRRARGSQFDPRLVDSYCLLENEFGRTYASLAEEPPQAPSHLVAAPLAAATF